VVEAVTLERIREGSADRLAAHCRSVVAELRAGARPDRRLLRAKDQALLDAYASGDRKVWDQTLAADALYVAGGPSFAPSTAKGGAFASRSQISA